MENTPVFKYVRMLDEETVEIACNDNVRITLKNMGEACRQVSETTGNKRVARLLVIGKNTEITNAARLALAEENRRYKGFIIGEAIIIQSFHQMIYTNLYMRFVKRGYPVHCFKDMKNAKAWLTWLVKKDKRRKK